MRIWTQINSESRSSLVRPYDLESPELDIFVRFEIVSPDSHLVRDFVFNADQGSSCAIWILVAQSPCVTADVSGPLGRGVPSYPTVDSRAANSIRFRSKMPGSIYASQRVCEPLAHYGVAQAFGKGASASPRRTIDGRAPPAHRTHDFLNPLLRIQLRQDRCC